MSVAYSEILWLGAVVIVLAIGSLTGLWRRQDPGAHEPVKPLLLTPAERELILQEKIEILQKIQEAKAASKKARRNRRRQQTTRKSNPPA